MKYSFTQCRYIVLISLYVLMFGLMALARPIDAHAGDHHAVHTAYTDVEAPVIGPKGYHVGSYGDGAYWITDGLYNSMFIVSDEGVIVVDAPASYADKIPVAIREITDKPVRYFIYSHHHGDHTGGAGLFGDGVTYIAHALAAKELERVGDLGRPIPSVTFEDTYSLTLGNQVVELAYPGLQHSPGNVFIYLPQQKVLMLVDVLYPGFVPFQDFAMAASVPGFFETFEQARAYDFKHFQGGHVGRPGTKADFENANQYVLDVQANAGLGMQVASPPGSYMAAGDAITQPYFPINTYIGTAAEICAQMTLETWRGRLQAADLYTEGHCRTTVINMMID